MSKHTPGPWNIGPTSRPDKEFCVADTSGLIICRFDLWKGDEEAEQDANARLIAAAPELLKALQNIDSNAAESAEWIRRVARTAIAKATEQG